MKIKNIIIIIIVLIVSQSILFAQTTIIHFNYDNSGNRTDRWIEIIQLKNQNTTVKNDTLNINDLTVLTQDSLAQLSSNADGRFNVFPNPVNEILNIQYTGQNSTIEYNYQIYDGSGKLFSSGKSNQIQNEVNLSKAKSGIYYLSITKTNGGDKLFWKLIKQ